MLAQSGAVLSAECVTPSIRWVLAMPSMMRLNLCFLILCCAELVGCAGWPAGARAADDVTQPSAAQSTEGKDKEDKRKLDELGEIARALPGPAGQPECVWVGQRAVSLIWRDDLDTAFRHLELYDRFGCPAAHVQETFRCVVRQGNIDPKAPESLNSRVHACWLNPALGPTTASSEPAPGKAPGSSNQ